MKFRIVLIGDTKQLASVEAGKPFEQLLSVIKSTKLTTIIRQQDDAHKEAIRLVADNKILRSYKIHEHNIKEGKNKNNFVKQAVSEYMSLTKNERDETILISPTRIHRDEINRLVVQELTKKGALSGDKFRIDILKQKDVTKADHNFASSYEAGNIVKFHSDYQSKGINRGDYLEVTKINEITNTITFNKGLKSIRFNLKTNIDYESKLEIFKQETLDLQKGIKIRITKNDQKLINSETSIIEDVNKNNITLRLEDDSKRIIPTKQLRHIDYGYASTIHSAQGKTTNSLIAAISSNTKLNNQKSWLVAISRHRHNLSIYMDSKVDIQKQIMTNKGEVKSASDIIFSNNLQSQRKLEKVF